MKSIWDDIFKQQSDSFLWETNREAFQELADAVHRVENIQASPEHQRILHLIAEKIRPSNEDAATPSA